MKPGIIDAHTHLGLESFIVKPIPEEKLSRPAFKDRMENRIEDFIRRLDENHIARAVAFPFPLEEVDIRTANRYVLDAYRANPERIIPFVLIDSDIGFWIEKGARGFKQHFLMTPNQSNLKHAYQKIADAGLPLIVHFSARQGRSIHAQVLNLKQEVPGLKLIVAHMGRLEPNTGAGVRELARQMRDLSHVYLETSSVRDSHAVKKAVEIIGEDRVLFGSDFPFNSYQDSNPIKKELDTIYNIGLEPHVLKKILGKNLINSLAI